MKRYAAVRGLIRPWQLDNDVKEHILALRATGLTNMFDVNAVQRLAVERDFHELAAALTMIGQGMYGSS